MIAYYTIMGVPFNCYSHSIIYPAQPSTLRPKTAPQPRRRRLSLHQGVGCVLADRASTSESARKPKFLGRMLAVFKLYKTDRFMVSGLRLMAVGVYSLFPVLAAYAVVSLMKFRYHQVSVERSRASSAPGISCMKVPGLAQRSPVRISSTP